MRRFTIRMTAVLFLTLLLASALLAPLSHSTSVFADLAFDMIASPTKEPSSASINIVPESVRNGSAGFLRLHSSTDILHILFMLPVRDEPGMSTFLADVTNPTSPHYLHYLTLEQANTAFNPDIANEAPVLHWLAAAGITNVQTWPNHLYIGTWGTTDAFSRLLSIQINDYQLAGHKFYAPDRDPTLPSEIKGHIHAIVGLSDEVQAHTFNSMRGGNLDYQTQNAKSSATEVNVLNGRANGHPPYYPQDLANAYNVNPFWTAGYTGSHITIAIVLWDVPPSDRTLNKWSTDTGAAVATRNNRRLEVIPIGTGPTTPDDGEAAIDIEAVGALAYRAHIRYYGAISGSTQDLADALQTAGLDPANRLISNSWDQSENPTARDAFEPILKSNTITGHNYLFASGDYGSSAYNGSDPWPSYPAVSGFVTSVGGTTFDADIGSDWPGERAWDYNPVGPQERPVGSGGGFSIYNDRPWWQIGPGFPTDQIHRGYPDVSAVADGNTGAYVCFDPDGSGNNTRCGPAEGTSLSSPLWAGMLALVDEILMRQGKGVLGLANPTLYWLANNPQTYAPYHDISSGTNGSYNTGPDWDPVTGLGTPNLWNIARDLDATRISSDVALLAPFDAGTRAHIIVGYRNPPDDSNCHVGLIVPDHCGNQAYGFDLEVGQPGFNILAPAPGWVHAIVDGFSQTKCLNYDLKDGKNLNICHFTADSLQVTPDPNHVNPPLPRGTILGTSATSAVHLSLDDRSGSPPYPPRAFVFPETLEGQEFPPANPVIRNQYADNTELVSTNNLADSSPVSVSPVAGDFFPNPSDSGTFTAHPGDPVAFSQTFPVINFNPPDGAVQCSNATGVSLRTRPFTDIAPQQDGSCLTIPAQGSGQQAGLDNLFNFNAVFRGTLTVRAPAQVTFNFYSDDGWILSIGPSGNDQPSHVSGPLVNPPSIGPFTGYSVVGSYNTPSTPAQNDLVVNFPAAGTYPFELDYSECCDGELSLTMTANSHSIPGGATISGAVYANSRNPSNLLRGARVQVCGTGPCVTTLTSALGRYTVSSLAPGYYIVTAFPPGGSNLLPNTISQINLSNGGAVTGEDVVLTSPALPPQGTDITPHRTGDGGLPVLYWYDTLTLSTHGCRGGTATYQMLQYGVRFRNGLMTESPSGTYTARIDSVYPTHDYAHVVITLTCSGTHPTTIPFDVYIDPSGTVRTVAGVPITGATVMLYRSDNPTGPFDIVPAGNGILSPANRRNPDTTDRSGHFGWDVVAGYYKIRAAYPGCTSPTNATQPYVESNVLTIPPPVTDLDLRLYCPNLTPTPSCQISFSDVQPTDYFYTPVRYLACLGAISGYADGTFRPFNDTTRGQLTKIVVLAQGWTIDTSGGPHFSDVPPANPFYNFIETAYQHGIISGYADGTFRWGNNVTRGQLSKIITLAEGWPTDTSGGPHFSDVPAANTFYSFIETAYHHGIISGYADGTFRPGNNATRGQIAKMVYIAITGQGPPPSPIPTTNTPIPANSPTRTPVRATATHVPANTVTPTPRRTPTNIPTNTPTWTPTPLRVPTSTPTWTPTNTPTWTPTPRRTPTPTSTNTPTWTPTWTPTPTFTNTPTWTPTPLPSVCNYIISQVPDVTIVPATTDIGNHCDDCTTNISLPFAYTLYNQTYTSANVSSNGTLQFVSNSTAYNNSCLPTADLDTVILPYWDDLVTNPGGIYTSVTGSAPNRVFNIEWRAGLYSNGLRLDFELRLYEGQQRFDIIYAGISGGQEATIGVQDGTGSYYTQFSCNTPNPLGGLQLIFTPDSCTGVLKP